MPAPYAPQLVVLQTGNGQNLVSWNPVLGAASYQVQRSMDGITYANVGAPPTTNSFLDDTVVVGLNYWYQVAAVNTDGSSSFTKSYPPSIVPCLPGQINLGYLRYQAQLRADKLNSQYLTLDEWNVNLNNSKNRLADLLTVNFGEDYFVAPPLLLTLTGLDSYPLPDGSNYSKAPALYKLLGVSANISGSPNNNGNAAWVSLPRFNWSDRDRYTAFPGQAGALNNAYQMAYRQMGQSLYVIPSNQNMTLKLTYVPIQTQMLQDQDMLPFGFNAWWEWVVNDAAKKAMVKEESLEKWNALTGENAAIEAAIQSSAKNRDVGQPNSVSNVRATMGDIGFSGWSNGGGFAGGMGGGGI